MVLVATHFVTVMVSHHTNSMHDYRKLAVLDPLKGSGPSDSSLIMMSSRCEICPFGVALWRAWDVRVS